MRANASGCCSCSSSLESCASSARDDDDDEAEEEALQGGVRSRCCAASLSQPAPSCCRLSAKADRASLPHRCASSEATHPCGPSCDPCLFTASRVSPRRSCSRAVPSSRSAWRWH